LWSCRLEEGRKRERGSDKGRKYVVLWGSIDVSCLFEEPNNQSIDAQRSYRDCMKYICPVPNGWRRFFLSSLLCHAIKKHALAKYNDNDTTESDSNLN
jgi:hypothetical protein